MEGSCSRSRIPLCAKIRPKPDSGKITVDKVVAEPFHAILGTEVHLSQASAMDPLPPPLAFLRLLFSGWINRQQQAVIDYLREENRILRAAYGSRPGNNQGLDLVVCGRADPPELRTPASLEVPAFQKEHMVMDVQIQRSAKALNQRHGARLKPSAKPLALCLLAEVSVDRPVNDGEAAGLDVGIFGQDES
jgi:hypothetical protein